jgi:hypothetical protein
LRRGKRGKVPSSREERRKDLSSRRREERKGRTKAKIEFKLLFKEGERRTKLATNIITFILLWFKCCVPYLHDTQGRHEYGQWSKYKTSTSQTTLNPARKNNRMNELKKLSSKCTS